MRRYLILFAAWVFLVLCMLSAQESFGQTNGGLLPALPPQFQNAANGKLCTQAAGTTTALATYSDSALTSALPTVISLNALGRPTTGGGTETAIYLQARNYKVSLYTAGSSGTCNGQAVGSLVWTRDNVYDLATLFKANFATENLDNVRLCDQFPGSTAGAQIVNCIADLPSTGGTAYARGFEGAQTIATDIFNGVTKHVILLLGAATYTVTANQTLPCTGCGIQGLGGISKTTVLSASAAVTKLFSVTGSGAYINEVQLEGASTSGATGIVFGDGSTWTGNVTGLRVTSFAGTGGIGVRIGDSVDGSFYSPYWELSETDALVAGVTNGSFPTTTNVYGGEIRTATAKNIKITSANNVNFIGTVFESATQEGFYIDCSASGNILDVRIIGGYFENNYGSDTTNYQFKSTCPVATGTSRFELRGVHFAGSGSTAKSINIVGDGNAGFVLDDPQTPSTAAGIIVQTNAYGYCSNFPRNLTFTSVVSQTTGGTCYNTSYSSTNATAALTTNKIPKSTTVTPPAIATLTDSAITDNGTTTTVAENFAVTGSAVVTTTGAGVTTTAGALTATTYNQVCISTATICVLTGVDPGSSGTGFTGTLTNHPFLFRTNNTEVGRFGPNGGFNVGSPTGGDKGSGTINIANDIYKNNSAYTNPDYAFEKFYTGSIKKFAKNPGASSYKGLMPLSSLMKFTKQNNSLPGVHETSGMFERSDILLEKLEEAYIYIFQLNERLIKLEAAKKK